jgi:hypothetical protein
MWENEKSRKDKSGKRWHFHYWYSGPFVDKTRQAQRLFFWDDSKECCGVVLFSPDKTVPYSRIKSKIKNLVAHDSVRRKFQRDLIFPLEENYAEYGDFPEENIRSDPK